MRRARRGLSEVLGAFLLVVIMLGAAATIYTLELRARNAMVEAVDAAKRGLAAVLSPPIVTVEERNGSVYATITSDTGVTLRAIVVLPVGGRPLLVPGPISVAPGEHVEVRLYNGSCKPMRLLLAVEGAPAIRYPSQGYYCDPASTPSLVDPATGAAMVSLQVEPPTRLPADTTASARINLSIAGKVSRDGPSSLYPLRVYLGGEHIGALTPLNNKVDLGSLGPVNLSIVARKIPGAYVVLLEIESNTGYYVAAVNATSQARLYASTSNPIYVCTDITNWIAPTLLGPITDGFSVSGACTIKSSLTGYTLRGNITAQARLLAASTMILLTAANDKAITINASYTLEITLFNVTPQTAEASIPNIGLPLEAEYERPKPRIGNAYRAELKMLSVNLSSLLDPTLTRITLESRGQTLGEWMIGPLRRNLTIRGDLPSVDTRISIAQLLPAVQAWWLKLVITSTGSGNTQTFYLDGSLGVMSGPQAWTFPARLTIDHGSSGRIVIIAGAPWPITGTGPEAAVFPASPPLESQASTVLTVPGWIEPYSYASTLATGAPTEHETPLTYSELASTYTTPALVMVYAPVGSLGLPWGGTVEVFAGQALWVN